MLKRMQKSVPDMQVVINAQQYIYISCLLIKSMPVKHTYVL